MSGYHAAVNVRVGLGLGAAVGTTSRPLLADVVDELERLRFDSVWFTERVNGPSLDPMVAMTFAVARTERLKVGTSVMVLPGRNPVLLAKAFASLDQVSNGRAFPALGLGAVSPVEQQSFGIAREDRAAWFDEALPLMRRLWREDNVTHHGDRFNIDNVTVLPKPVNHHIDIWLGGAARSELQRCGRLGDGWLPSFCTPSSVKHGIDMVNDAAVAAGRTIDPEHFGVLIGYVEGEIPPPIAEFVTKRDPKADPRDVVAGSLTQVAELVRAVHRCWRLEVCGAALRRADERACVDRRT